MKSIVDDGRMLDVVIGAAGAPPSDKAVSEVGLGSLKMLDEARRVALDGAGIGTVGQFAAVEPVKVMSLLTKAGIVTDASRTRIAGRPVALAADARSRSSGRRRATRPRRSRTGRP